MRLIIIIRIILRTAAEFRSAEKRQKVVLEVKSNSREYDDFIKYVKEVLSSSETAMQDEVSKRILTDIEKKEFMPKQVSKNNSTLPYQLNLAELDAILENASKYSEYAFLNEKTKTEFPLASKSVRFNFPYAVLRWTCK